MKSVPGKMIPAWLPLLFLLATGQVAAADNHAALVLVSTGTVSAVDAGGQTRALGRRAPVFVGDTVVTGEGSIAQLKFTDGSLVAMKADSQLRIERYSTKEGGGADAFGVSVLKGGFRSLTGAIGKRSPAEYKVGARVATIGIRGTDYEVDLDLDNGLGLGVWQGGIEACNDDGCLELGAGEPFRFGFVPIRGGAPQGRLQPPAGVGGGTVPPPAAGSSPASGGAGGPPSQGDVLEGAVVEDGESAIMPPPGTAVGEVLNPVLGPEAPVDLRAKNPYVALGVARTTTSPLGDAYAADFAALEFGTEAMVTGFRFSDAAEKAVWSADASTLASGVQGEQGVWGVADWRIGQSDGTQAFVIRGLPGSTGFNGEPLAEESLAVVGQYVAPTVVSALQGTLAMSLSPSPHVSAIWGSSMYHMVDGLTAAGGVDTLDASLNLAVDFTASTAAGALAFSDAAGRWKLHLDGAVTSQGLSLAVASGTGGSVFRPWAESVDYGVAGSVTTRFVGHATVDGLLGAFRVVTDPVSVFEGPLHATGVFVAEQHQLPAAVDHPFHALAVATTATTPLGDMYRADAGVLDSTLNPVNPTVEDIHDFGFTNDGITWLTQSGDPAQSGSVNREGWRVANQTLVGFMSGPSLVHGDLVWGDAIGETVYSVFGHRLDKTLVPLTGFSSFALGVDSIDGPALRYEQDGVAGVPSFAELFLDVDFTAATAAGNLTIGDSLGTWNLGLAGAVNGNGLLLSVEPGVDGGSTGSLYTPIGQTGAPSLGVTGTAAALFVGSTGVDGLIGTFRAGTSAVAQAPHVIHGAFVATPLLAQ